MHDAALVQELAVGEISTAVHSPRGHRPQSKMPLDITLMPEFPTRPEQILQHPARTFVDTDWHRALDRDDSDGACDAFIRAVRTGPPRTRSEHDIPALYREWFDTPGIGFQGGHHLDPDMVVEQRYIGVYGIEHQFLGEIDWLYDPTRDWGDDQTAEWQVQLNRHYQWIPLADKYRETGDAKYAHAFERELRSWVRQCPRPDDNGMGLPGCWRLIEVGIRAGWTWPYAFETFRQSEHVSDEAVWLMVTALHEHGMHLLLWPTGRNFKTMETNGLAHVGAMFPEMRMARSFLTTAIDRAVAELDRQIYPDGLQDELSPSYGNVALSNLYSAIRVAEQHESFGTEIPRRAFGRFSDCAYALGRIADPDAKLPPIHDSPSSAITDLFAHFRDHLDAERFAREPWCEPGVDHLAWGGWTIMRRNQPQRYSLFDAGPWGTGHQHADALQLLTYAHGRWFCIDPGKPLYNRSTITRYMRSSQGHNVVLIDGRRHGPDPQVRAVREPCPTAVHASGGNGTAGAVYAVAAKRGAVTVDDGPETRFRHERVVLDVAELGWLVYDRVQSDDDGPHTWEWLWHTSVERVAVLESQRGAHLVYPGGPGLLIQPIAAERDAKAVHVNVTRGQTEPVVRGWHSVGRGDTPTPTPTVSVGRDAAAGPVAMFTLLVPAADESVPSVDVTEVRMSPDEASVALSAADARFRFAFTGGKVVERIDCALPSGDAVRLAIDPHTFEG
ncbi:MAG: heparinase II/III family protein [bacterium]